VKVFVTGGTGFIGGHVVRKLAERGDDVTALVRDPAGASDLAKLGVTLVKGDVSDKQALREAMRGSDAVIHGAAIYKVGIPKDERQGMYESNVLGTENVLRAALEEEIPKVVYVSTVAAFGNTRGKVVDETYRHPHDNYTSYYEQTKVEAHDLARRLIDEEGLPCVIIQPGGVYGPDDHSSMGQQINQFLAGKMPMIAFPELGLNMVHVEDVADGILLGLDKGQTGEQYILGGQITTMREVIDTVGRVADRKPPSRAIPTGLMKAMTPIGGVVGRMMGQPPNLSELISSADNVTFWAKHDKAMEKLGYSPRGLEQGLRDMLEAEGKLPAGAAPA
jgi:nucleoside-diphosphate-sugar epimerase